LAFALLVACFGALAGCRSHAPEAPVVAGPPPLTPYLAGVYGANASSDAPWTDAEQVQRSVCAFGPVPGDDRARRLLAVCGTPADAGHATPGLVDFHVVEPTGAGWHTVDIARDQEFGSSGNPGVVTLAHLGRARAGFVVESGATGQGWVIGTRTLLEFRGGTLATLAVVRSELDNEGVGCDPGPDCAAQAVALTFDLGFDAANPTADAYPLLVHEHGSECGETVERRHRLEFDAALGRYPVPPALMREACLRNVDPASGVANP
jgi:hypothetical protein